MIYREWPSHIFNKNTTKELRNNEFLFSINLNGKIYSSAGRVEDDDNLQILITLLSKQLFSTLRDLNENNNPRH